MSSVFEQNLIYSTLKITLRFVFCFFKDWLEKVWDFWDRHMQLGDY